MQDEGEGTFLSDDLIDQRPDCEVKVVEGSGPWWDHRMQKTVRMEETLKKSQLALEPGCRCRCLTGSQAQHFVLEADARHKVPVGCTEAVGGCCRQCAAGGVTPCSAALNGEHHTGHG